MGNGDAVRSLDRRQAGFTLVELLVVMAIIAVLLTLAAPHYIGNVDKAKEAVLKQNLALTRDALEKYYGDTGRYPEHLQDLVARHYLRKLPYDPIADRDDAWVIVPPGDRETGGVYDLHSSAQGKARDGTPYAQW